jgi:hypothetical protein
MLQHLTIESNGHTNLIQEISESEASMIAGGTGGDNGVGEKGWKYFPGVAVGPLPTVMVNPTVPHYP